jgi:hypothetical protein
MQVAVSIRLYEYEHEQAKLKKKRRNNIFFLLKINMEYCSVLRCMYGTVALMVLGQFSDYLWSANNQKTGQGP